MSKVAKTTMYLMIVTALAKILGMGRELVLSSVYGTGIYTESYITAMNIPNVVFVAISTAIVTTFIPMYQDISSNQGEDRATKFLNNVLNIVIIICIFISILGVVFAKNIVNIFAVGFKGEELALTVKFTKILIMGLVFISISAILSAFLQIKDKFVAVGFGSVPYNIVIITSIYLSSIMGVYILPIGVVVAMIVQFLFYIFFLKGSNYKYSKRINIKDENFKRLLILLGPVLIGIAVDQINALVDNSIASTLAKGSIASLSYANRLNGFVTGIFTASVVSVVYPMLSKLSAQENKDKFIRYITSSINIIICLLIPIAIGTMVLAKPVVRILFERGAFDAKSTHMTAVALICYSIGMLSFGLRDILSKVFYSLKDTRTPMVNGIICVVFNIVLSLILKEKLGHAGLALGTSIASSICIILMLCSLRKKVGYFGQDKIISVTLKSLFSGGLMGILIDFLYKVFIRLLGDSILSEVEVVFMLVVIGAGVYVFLVSLLKIEEINTILNLMKNKLNNFKY